MRIPEISVGEYYHLYNRGVAKQNIFFDERDYVRFLLLILYCQSLHTITNPGFHVSHFIEHSIFNISKKTRDSILADRHVELTAFCLMPNHFHLMVREKEEGGIGRYMQRVLNAYTKYINAKYGKSGHLFQGPYQAVHVDENKQLLYLSTYIHRNPRELKSWKNKENRYPWSSYPDYCGNNRWGELLSTDIVLDQFSSKENYHAFSKSSPAKEGVGKDLALD